MQINTIQFKSLWPRYFSEHEYNTVLQNTAQNTARYYKTYLVLLNELAVNETQ